MPWQAPEAVDRILQKSRRPAPAAKSVPGGPAPSVRVPSAGTEISPREEGATVFRSGVRMVNLLVAVVDAGGPPVTDLSPEDFAIVEDGEPQQVEFAGSEDLPFNLAILLDLSGSTRPDRAAMIAASKRFVEMAGDQDRVAIYALAGDLFHVVAPLTSDRASLIATLSKIPGVSGGSPLYDAIALAYAEELHDREGEKNALVIISDGIDNRLSGQADAPSRLKFRRLLKAAGQMNALLYPVFLLSGERFGRGWSKKARKRMQQLADASHGRVFEARSIQDLEPVYPLLASELRAIYSVAYYPSNQDFRGRWRKVQVKVRRPGATPRTRKGYFAR
jgi:Ca-activated chloride channel family protein